MTGVQELPLVSMESRFAQMVERHANFVYRVAYAIVRNKHDAEDIAQDTFLKLHRIGGWEEVRDERAFLAKAAWRMALGRARRPVVILEAEPVSTAPNPETAALAANWHATVHRMIDSLPEDLRQPLALSGLQETNSHQIAEIMGISEGTVRTRLARARQLLKQKLANYR